MPVELSLGVSIWLFLVIGEHFVKSIPFYAKRFVAGATAEQALSVVRSLNDNQICATIDLLGESIKSKEQVFQFTNEYVDLLDSICKQKLNAYISLKLTNLGLDIDAEFCEENLEKILRKADECHSRVAFDMEGSGCTEKTLVLYEKMSQKFQSPELVIQAYLYRTLDDVKRVLSCNGRVRLCKGAYQENKQIAFQSMSDIRDNYKKLLKELLQKGQRVCIATHDDELIDFAKDYIKENNIPKDRYEFQMLFGMRKKTWHKLVSDGHNMTIYVPYGTDWKAYFFRRISERKENLFFVFKNLFRS